MLNYMCSVCMFVDKSVKEYPDGEFYCPSCRPKNEEQSDPMEIVEVLKVSLDRVMAESERLRAENERLADELREARELMAEIEFRVTNSGYSLEDIRETAREIDQALVRRGYRK